MMVDLLNVELEGFDVVGNVIDRVVAVVGDDLLCNFFEFRYLGCYLLCWLIDSPQI